LNKYAGVPYTRVGLWMQCFMCDTGVDVTARFLQRRYASVEMSVEAAADLVDRFSGASQEDNPERAIFR